MGKKQIVYVLCLLKIRFATRSPLTQIKSYLVWAQSIIAMSKALEKQLKNDAEQSAMALMFLLP